MSGKTKGVAKKETQSPPAPAIVALFSTRDVTWEGVGTVKPGYNFVTQEQADKWLKRNHIRVVTPEEIKMEFGN
jgi:hypothetical protein